VEKCDRARRSTDDHRPRRMRIVYWIRKAADTYTEYIILIACPRKQRLRERERPFSVLFCSTTARYVNSMILKKKLNPREMLGAHGRGLCNQQTVWQVIWCIL
jgi:hypothetical protein